MKKNLFLLLTATALLAACSSPRMTIITGTSVGLHLTPGNGQETPPQVSLAYKRTELALIPVSRAGAHKTGTSVTNAVDAYSSLAGFDFRSSFFGGTIQLQQFISTGFASRELLDNSAFTAGFGQ
jgi:hypothetical protein